MEELNPKLLEILACPACKADVKYENEKICCVNSKCLKKYPVKDGIPIMLIEEAEDPFKK